MYDVDDDNIVSNIQFGVNVFRYVDYFGLPGATDDVYQMLAHVAKQQDLVTKHKSPSGKFVLVFLLSIIVNNNVTNNINLW